MVMPMVMRMMMPVVVCLVMPKVALIVVVQNSRRVVSHGSNYVTMAQVTGGSALLVALHAALMTVMGMPAHRLWRPLLLLLAFLLYL